MADKGAHNRVGDDVAEILGAVNGAAVEHTSVHEHHRTGRGLEVNRWGDLTKGSLALFIQVMGAGDDQRSTIDLVDVLKDVNGVDEKGRPGGKARRRKALVLMDALRVAARKRDVRNEAQVGPVRAKGFVEKLLYEGPGLDGFGFVSHAGNKDIALVHQRPDMLLRFR